MLWPSGEMSPDRSGSLSAAGPRQFVYRWLHATRTGTCSFPSGTGSITVYPVCQAASRAQMAWPETRPDRRWLSSRDSALSSVGSGARSARVSDAASKLRMPTKRTQSSGMQVFIQATFVRNGLNFGSAIVASVEVSISLPNTPAERSYFSVITMATGWPLESAMRRWLVRSAGLAWAASPVMER